MKTHRALFVLAIALPLGIAEAQQPTTPPANPIATAFRGRTTAARRNIALALDSIPADKYGYKPTPAQLTVGYIAAHVASDNYIFCNNFGEKKAVQSALALATHDSIKQAWPKDSLVTRLKASIAFCDEAMALLDDAQIAATITVAGANNTTRQVSRAGYVLAHALDLADHYSQLANYMRLNGILPPTARRP